MEISLENLYVDNGAERVNRQDLVPTILHHFLWLLNRQTPYLTLI